MIKLLFAYVLFVTAALASETRTTLRVTDSEGNTHRVFAYNYINHLGRPEVRLVSGAVPQIAANINATLGYGRDTDDDGRIESWFMVDPNGGLVRYELRSTQALGYDMVRTRLFRQYASAAQMHVIAFTNSLLSYLSMAVSNAARSDGEFLREWMDSAELQLRINRARQDPTSGFSPAQFAYAQDLVTESYRRSLEKYDRAVGRDYWALAAADVGLWATGGIVVRWAASALPGASRIVGSLPPVQFARRNLARFITSQRTMLTNALARSTTARRVFAAPIAAVTLRTLGVAAFKRQFHGGITALSLRARLKARVAAQRAPVLQMLRAAGREWRYVALSTSLQLGAEAFANYSEVRSNNPVTFAGNVLSHPDIQQNVAYMTTETVMMTAASSVIVRGRNRWIACGFIAVANSSVMNFVIKRSNDYQRIALDTGWEMFVGASQVQLDLAALKFFEEMGVRRNNPRLKLLGYAVVVVDQGVGYYAYSQATQAIAPAGPVPTRLVPVYAEQ